MNLKEIPMANPDLGVLEEKAIFRCFKERLVRSRKKNERI